MPLLKALNYCSKPIILETSREERGRISFVKSQCYYIIKINNY